MNKFKIVWLCVFANAEVAKALCVSKNIVVAPWISELMNLFKNRNDIELFIVSPNYYSNNYQSFLIDNISVYLFKYRPSYIPKNAYNLTFNYLTTQQSVSKIIDEINPDLIHLFGSENPLYAAGIFALKKKYPILVTVQGFVFLSTIPSNIISKYIRWNRIRIEQIINRNAKYFTYGTRDSLKVLNDINPSSKKFHNYYPTTIPEVNTHSYPQKKYDLVYFARISKDKGVEDFIEAVFQLKQNHKKIKAIIIGGGNENYIHALKIHILKKNLTDNITFAGFQPTQQDVFNLAAQAKVYVLPTYFDGIPGSIREAMYMQIPVVAYDVGGIPTFNDQAECVTLANQKDISDLVAKILMVLSDNERTQKLIANAYDLIKNKFDNNNIYNNWISIYNQILNNQV